jgi:hypothetical protein
VAAITKAEFRGSGFSDVQGLRRIVGWHAASSIAVEVASQLAAGERFVYAYYEGVDRVAHAHGFGPFYDAELAAADRLVSAIASVLPRGAALVVTSDHGQVDVGDATMPLAKEIVSATSTISGEARFLWLHARRGAVDDVLDACRAHYGDVADVRLRDDLVEDGWFGPASAMADVVRSRLGDVAILARAAVAVLDPNDPGSSALRCRHGSLTPDELRVPLVAVGSPA